MYYILYYYKWTNFFVIFIEKDICYMDKLEEIKENLQRIGFKKEDNNRFVFENISYNKMSINGNVIKQKVKEVLTIIYTGVGGEVDDNGNCSNDMYFFDIFHNENQEISVGVYDFKDFAEIIGINYESKN